MSQHHKAAKWSGANVTKARNYWAPKIKAAADAGTPLLCSFAGHKNHPDCPGPVLITDKWVVDHKVRLADGGAALDPNNTHPAHGKCNSRDSALRTNAMRNGIPPCPPLQW